MDIAGIQRKKTDLELSIRNSLLDFTRETNCNIIDINLRILDEFVEDNMQYTLYDVEVEVRI